MLCTSYKRQCIDCVPCAHENVYFAAAYSEIGWIEQYAPEIQRVAIQLPQDEVGILEMAEQYPCNGVQFWYGMFDEALIRKLHKKIFSVMCFL